MNIHTILISFVLMLNVFQASQAHASGWDDFVRRVQNALGIKDDGYQECPDQFKSLEGEGLTAKQMFERGMNSRKKNDHCEAARAFSELTRIYPNSSLYRQAWLELVRSYRLAKEDELAINEGARMAFEMRASKTGEAAHLIVMEIVHEKIQPQKGHMEQPWTEFAMGTHGSQTKGNPYFQNLMFRSFMEIYPNSSALPKIQKWHDEARNELAGIYLKQGRLFAMQREYVLAMKKFALLLRWGPVIDVFPNALYEAAVTNYRFAGELLDRTKIIDERLLDLMRSINPNGDLKITPRLRKSLSDQTYAQAFSLLEMMRENLPEHPLTRRAVSEMPRP